MNRDYVYYNHTKTFCSTCSKMIDGKIVYNKSGAYILKECDVCGVHKEILEEDFEYHLKKILYDKEGTRSLTQTEYSNGCPFDCGLCPSHDQHTCIGLIEITKRCNLNCDMCFAKSCEGVDLSLEMIEKMMDFYMESENNNAEILQISGGEPTLHKDIIKIIQLSKNKGFRYVMLNTNGLLIDDEFAKKLSKFKGGFEVYLQFDGLNNDVYEKMRGKPLWDIKKRAIYYLSKYSIPTTLVMTVEKGINDAQIGEVTVFGMKEKCVRGINFQPISFYGDYYKKDRITLSGILNEIDKQTAKMIEKNDFIPLPCNVERNAITYLFKDKKHNFIPITRDKNLSEFKNQIGNTFMFTIEDTVKNFNENSNIFNLCPCCDLITDIKKYLPTNFIFKSKEEKMIFVDENTFRLSVSSFLDKYNFDIKSMKKECVHIITPDLKRIPFSAFNMFHREKYDKFYM